EAIGGWPPTVGACGMEAVPQALAGFVLGKRWDGVNDGILPVQVRKDAVVHAEHGFRRQTVAPVGPDPDRSMGTQHQDLRAKALGRDAMILCIPLAPLLPLVAAHPAEHERDALLVCQLHNVLTRNLGFPP